MIEIDMWSIAEYAWSLQIETILPIAIVLLVAVYVYRILDAAGDGLNTWAEKMMKRWR